MVVVVKHFPLIHIITLLNGYADSPVSAFALVRYLQGMNDVKACSVDGEAVRKSLFATSILTMPKCGFISIERQFCKSVAVLFALRLFITHLYDAV